MSPQHWDRNGYVEVWVLIAVCYVLTNFVVFWVWIQGVGTFCCSLVRCGFSRFGCGYRVWVIFGLLVQLILLFCGCRYRVWAQLVVDLMCLLYGFVGVDTGFS